MLNNIKFKLEYKKGDKYFVSNKIDCDDYSISSTYEKNILKLTIIPKHKIELIKSSLEYDFQFADDAKVFANGYQSWTVSREYTRNDIQKGLVGLSKFQPIKSFADISADYNIVDYANQAGAFHSFSYDYIIEEEKIFLIDSLSERKGYTIINYYMINNKIIIDKDIEGVSIDKEYELYNLFETETSYEKAFDEYFSVMKIKKPREKFMCGYTSWYNYFGTISEASLIRDLESISCLGDKVDIFQIDDGYQSAVGDWLTIKEDKYPMGMKYIADKIHSCGYKAGIWIAPFNCQNSSKIKKEHPEWLVRNKLGKPIKGCIAWGGAYTIDFYNQEAAKYIKNFFNEILNEWGFDMVKLDFLYSICMEPRNNKSRGQIMCEAVDFLRECVGEEKYILGCGVPLAPAFGKFDFCRISCDVELSFKDRFYVKHTNQEIISAKNAMNNTIFRRHLDGRAFVNDPDVFFLRENDLTGKDKYFVKKGKLRYTFEQKQLLAKINNICGNVLFVSDDISGYSKESLELIKNAFTPSEYTVVDAQYVNNKTIEIKYLDGKDMYKLVFDTLNGDNKLLKM